MKISVIVFGGLCLTASVHGQGIISFNNLSSLPEHKVYIDEWLNPSALAPGGTEFLVAVYFARFSDGEAALTQVGSSFGFAGAPDRTGIFIGGARTVPTETAGGGGLFQVKGWESAYGATYEEASANPLARIGQSPIFIADTAEPNSLDPIEGLVGANVSSHPFRGFVIAVPEPSTSLLALAGIVVAFFVSNRGLRSRKAISGRPDPR